MIATRPRGDFNPPSGYDEWPEGEIALTAEQVRRYLDVSPELLRQWVARGHIARLRGVYDMGSVMNHARRLQQRGELHE